MLGLSETLKEHVKHLSEIIDDRNQNLDDVENSIEEIETRVSNLKKEILKHIDSIEETLKGELTSSKKQVNIKLKDEVDTVSSHRSAVKNWKAVIDSVLEHGSEQQCLIEIDKIEPEVSELEGKLIELIKNIKRVSVSYSP